ncbi:MAG: hypothetical protein JWR11_1778 [Mycobacterium sp.]|nr:hypothetical protein [Mycobacterium sp.]
MGGQPLLRSSAVGVHRRAVMPNDPTPTTRSRGRVGAILWPGMAALAVCLFWTLLESTRLGVPAPFEDAAMLFRYAENLAHGWGITWNAGQAPGLTDGATDLGFVLALAPLTLLGLSTAAAAVLLNLAGVFGIGALFGVLNQRLWQRSLRLPIALAALVGGGPVDRYVLSGFSPPVMAFLLLAAFTVAALAPLARTRRASLTLLAGAGAAAGIAGWWRPEAFAFGPLAVFFGLLLTRRAGTHRTTSVATLCALMVPFGLFVFWWVALRIDYFGQLLPTSAVMKSGSLHGANALFSLQFYGSLLLPLMGVLVATMLGRGATRSWWIGALLLTAPLMWANAALPPDFWKKVGLTFVPTVADVATLAVFLPVVVALGVLGVRRRDGSWLLPVALLTFSLAWIAIATTLNWWGRMQWPLVPVLAAIAAGHAVAAGNALSPARADDRTARASPTIVLTMLTCIGLVPFHLPAGSYFESPFQTAVSAALQEVDTSHVRVATTEAGLIPLAVTGAALDTYGHNNRSIAATHGGSLTRELEAFRPNVLAVHGLPPGSVHLDDCSPEQQRGPTKFPANWSDMVRAIYDDAQRHGIALTRISETTPCETWSLWLSDDVEPQVRAAIMHVSMPGTELAVSAPRPGV